MSDLANIRPWVEASIRNGAGVPPEHAAVLLAEIDRRATREIETWREVERQQPPSADSSATLASVNDVRRVCAGHGLTEHANGRAWFDDRVSVRVVNGKFGWQVSIRDGMGGALVAEVGDFASLPARMLGDAIQAARSSS